MTQTHQVTIGKVKRDLPIIPVASGVKIALFNSLSDTEVIVEAAKELAKKLPKSVEILVTPEAKSIPLAFELSRITGLPYIVIRKTKKPYMGEALELDVTTITTGKAQTLYVDEKDVDLIKDKKVAIVDDVVSTGATVKAVSELITKAGGIIEATVAVFTEGDKDKWKDVISLGHLPVWID